MDMHVICCNHSEQIVMNNKDNMKGDNVMKVKDYLLLAAPNQFHIFDSHQEGMDELGKEHKDQDYVAYSYNIHHNNKPQPGDVFLYRRPGKSSKTRKFYIYGGGIIESITPPDREGNVLANICMPFKLNEPLMQDKSELLDNFVWTSKVKKPGSWGHFWNQYGMNVINEHDFWGLVGELECEKPDNHDGRPATIKESNEEDDGVDESAIAPSGFNVTITDSGKRMSASAKQSKEIKGTHIDYNALHKTKANIGKGGELLVVELLREQYDGTDVIVEHTSVDKGDGYGYDITVIHPGNHEEHIEVKTTKSTFVDGFYITPKELSAARQCEADGTNCYKIYRVYNYDPVHKTANIKVYDGPFTDEAFRFVPTAWKVYEK